ncbi:hypothetical protein ACFW9M_04515 [Streptomyces lydicus]|uniref:hypothetical protein n=1 Tax=Streptomyces lydicus TaxID=47763 RepID=UPI0036BAC1B7
MKTMPNSLSLARHYYEARREVLTAAGMQITPWYRLTQDERAVTVTEAAIIQEALRRAIEERATLLDGVTARLAQDETPGVVQV